LTSFGVGGLSGANVGDGVGDGVAEGVGVAAATIAGDTDGDTDGDGEGAPAPEVLEAASTSRGTEQAASGRTPTAAETATATMRRRPLGPVQDPLTRRHRSR
jgi:hypothetical protein